MNMKTLLFTECVDLVGSACKPFGGTKKYVSTGAVDTDHINDLDTEIVDYEGKPSRANLEVMAGDVLFAKMQGTKKTLMIDSVLADNIYSTGFYAVRAKKGVLTDRCLYHLLTSEMFLSQKDKNCSGATQKAITNAGLSKIVIHVPSIDEQNDIAAQLDAVIGIITKRQQELMALDALIKARLVEMFDLESCKWGTFGEHTDFVDYRGHTPELSDEGTIRMVNAKSVGKGFFKYVDEFVTEDVYNSWMHRGFGYPGDVLFVTEGHTFGNTCLVPRELVKFALGQRVITIKGHSDVINNAFLCTYMQTDKFWRDINVYRTGGTAQGIRSKDLVKIKIPLPPIEFQLQFAAFVAQVEKSKAAVQKSLDETQLLFDSLMQQYFG